MLPLSPVSHVQCLSLEDSLSIKLTCHIRIVSRRELRSLYDATNGCTAACQQIFLLRLHWVPDIYRRPPLIRMHKPTLFFRDILRSQKIVTGIRARQKSIKTFQPVRRICQRLLSISLNGSKPTGGSDGNVCHDNRIPAICCRQRVPNGSCRLAWCEK